MVKTATTAAEDEDSPSSPVTSPQHHEWRIVSWSVWWSEQQQQQQDDAAHEEETALESTRTFTDNNGDDSKEKNQTSPVASRTRNTSLLLDVREKATWLPWEQSPVHKNENDHDEITKHAATCLHHHCDPIVIHVHIPLSALSDRRFELPPRALPFAILLDHDAHMETTIETVYELLAGQRKNATSSSSSTARAACPWTITAVVVVESPVDDPTPPCALLPALSPSYTSVLFRPHPRLWQPDPMVQHVLLPLLKRGPKLLSVWDLGAGLGRDACFLAEELQHHHCCSHNNAGSPDHRRGDVQCSFHVTAVDQRYRNPSHTAVTTDFWARRGLLTDATMTARCIDLHADDPMTILAHILGDHDDCDGAKDEIDDPRTIPVTQDTAAVVVIYAVRFYHRPLWTALANNYSNNKHADDSAAKNGLGDHPRLLPGSIVAVSHFGKPYDGAPWKFAHPKEKHVLERSELRKLFAPDNENDDTENDSQLLQHQQRRWTILHDEVVQDSDHGRTLIQFVARFEGDVYSAS